MKHPRKLRLMRKPKDALKFTFKGRIWYGWQKKIRDRKTRQWKTVWTCKPAEWPHYAPPVKEWIGAIRSYARYRELHGIHLNSEHT